MDSAALLNIKQAITNGDYSKCSEIVERNKEILEALSLPDIRINTAPDELSNCLLDDEIAEKYTALATSGNGNCLYNSVSVLLKGKSPYVIVSEIISFD